MARNLEWSKRLKKQFHQSRTRWLPKSKKKTRTVKSSKHWTGSTLSTRQQTRHHKQPHHTQRPSTLSHPARHCPPPNRISNWNRQPQWRTSTTSCPRSESLCWRRIPLLLNPQLYPPRPIKCTSSQVGSSSYSSCKHCKADQISSKMRYAPFSMTSNF